MTNNIDPWELLREAREELSVLASYVGHPDTVWPNVGLKTTAKGHKIMRDRIDAALADHEAEMIEHRKNFARDCKDFDRTMAAWKNG